MSLFLGIDPGLSGAWAIIDESETIVSADTYEKDTFLTLFANSHVVLCALEKVASMPKQGVSSVFSFGENYGIWQGILKAKFIQHILVTPHNWQKEILDFVPSLKPGVPGEDAKAKQKRIYENKKILKDGITAFVLRRFSNAKDFIKLKKDQGIADAVCLALYAKRMALK